MDKRYLGHIARLDLTTYEYKILLLLGEQPYTQTQLARELCIAKQNMNKHMAKLHYAKLVEIDRVDGTNKYYKSVKDMKRLMEVFPGQLKI